MKLALLMKLVSLQTVEYFTLYYNFGTNGQDITENADYTLNGNTITVTYDDADP